MVVCHWLMLVTLTMLMMRTRLMALMTTMMNDVMSDDCVGCRLLEVFPELTSEGLVCAIIRNPQLKKLGLKSSGGLLEKALKGFGKQRVSVFALAMAVLFIDNGNDDMVLFP